MEFAVAGGLPLGRAGTRAVDGRDHRPIRHDKLNDLLARQAAPEGQDPAIVDDRDVEALPLPAHINTSPQRHGSKHALTQTRAGTQARHAGRAARQPPRRQATAARPAEDTWSGLQR
jgi:hypothetical protein